jgi:hypothetical protein
MRAPARRGAARRSIPTYSTTADRYRAPGAHLSSTATFLTAGLEGGVRSATSRVGAALTRASTTDLGCVTVMRKVTERHERTCVRQTWQRVPPRGAVSGRRVQKAWRRSLAPRALLQPPAPFGQRAVRNWTQKGTSWGVGEATVLGSCFAMGFRVLTGVVQE